MPTFCLICGIIGHSERFRHKLLDDSSRTIVKPYVLFIKAADRRNNKQIGARWLRDNMANTLDANFGDHWAKKGNRRSQDNGPRIMDVVMGNGENQRNGIKIQELVSGNDSDSENVEVIEARGSFSNQNGVIVIDN